jgi:hypothetical protein
LEGSEMRSTFAEASTSPTMFIAAPTPTI